MLLADVTFANAVMRITHMCVQDCHLSIGYYAVRATVAALVLVMVQAYVTQFTEELDLETLH